MSSDEEEGPLGNVITPKEKVVPVTARQICELLEPNLAAALVMAQRTCVHTPSSSWQIASPILLVSRNNPAAAPKLRAQMEPIILNETKAQLVGLRVVARGLVSKPEVNGRVGKIEQGPARGRFAVRFDDHAAPLLLKPMNLVGAIPGPCGLAPPTEEDDEWQAEWEALHEAVNPAPQEGADGGGGAAAAADGEALRKARARAEAAERLTHGCWNVVDNKALCRAVVARAKKGRVPETQGHYLGVAYWNTGLKARLLHGQALEATKAYTEALPVYERLLLLANNAEDAAWQEPHAAGAARHALERCQTGLAQSIGLKGV